MQFHQPDSDSGFVQFVRNHQSQEESRAFCLQGLQPDNCYVFTDAESGENFEAEGRSLLEWMTVSLPPHTGKILFYERKA